jgi:hypothetical protein
MPSMTAAHIIKDGLKNMDIKIAGAIPYEPLISNSNPEGRMLDKGDIYDAAEKVLDTLLQGK